MKPLAPLCGDGRHTRRPACRPPWGDGTVHRYGRAGLLMLAVALSIPGTRAANSPSPPSAAALAYAAQPRDTLIGLGRRLLIDPKRWPEVQRLNHIADPRRIPRGTILRLPYAWLRMRDDAATVANATGEVHYAAGPALPSGAALAAGQRLAPGAVIETGADGSATLELADGSVVTVQSSSTLVLERMAHVEGLASAHDIRLKLNSGRLESAVKPHRDVGRFEIATPVAVSAVRGTHFRNGFAAPEASATTETLDGSVAVAAGTRGAGAPDAGDPRRAVSVAVGAGYGTRVLPDRAPLPPVLLLPPPDLGGAPATNATPSLRLRWVAVAGAGSYRVQLASDAEFHAIRADATTTDPEVAFADLPDATYWLRARAIDPAGIEGRDAVRTLTQHRLPPTPTALSAARKSAGPGGPAGPCDSVTLTWADAGAGLRYHLQIARDPGFAHDLLERNPLPEGRTTLSGLEPGDYVWRVAAVNAVGEAGDFSAVESFVIPPPPPTVAIEVDARRAIHLHWRAHTGLTYRLQIARSAEFRHLVLDRRTESPELTLAPLFPTGYFVRAQNIGADGVAGDFGPARRFEAPPPLWLKVLVTLGALATLLR